MKIEIGNVFLCKNQIRMVTGLDGEYILYSTTDGEEGKCSSAELLAWSEIESPSESQFPTTGETA